MNAVLQRVLVSRCSAFQIHRASYPEVLRVHVSQYHFWYGIAFGRNAVFPFITGVFVHIFNVRYARAFDVAGFTLDRAALHCKNAYGTTSIMCDVSVIQAIYISFL